MVIGLRRFLGLIPGVLLLAILGYAGKVTEQSIRRHSRAGHSAYLRSRRIGEFGIAAITLVMVLAVARFYLV